MTRPWEEAGEIPDRMYTDGGVAMEQDPADYYGDSLALKSSVCSDLEELGATPEIRDRYCRDPRRFYAELAAVSELGIWFGIWKRLEEGLEVKGWIEMTGCGGVPLYRVADPVRAARFGWLTRRRNR